ncbi:vWA domain-containing protein [Longimicrobium sp.]|uniref:vWA domain-containing protein n=1 Tax=Longimicrobium sp. TaxID=2029185 RepID=UPI002E31E53B|nr:vWA domain-containing protein [Longimicrobium sp.]HEX6039420.1 vWA domain-containing protein [Longimicrobium sp.]
MQLRRVVWAVLALLLTWVRVADAQTRTVVIVYDDSGSMGNPQAPNARWRDANYALQTLTGLLSPRDALTVVRMSAPTQPKPVDLRDQAGQITAIRTAPHRGQETPYAAVETAMRVLEQAADREAQSGGPASEKWLIIVTDGEFSHADSATVQGVQQDIRQFVQRTGTRTAIFLLAGVQSTAADLWVSDGQARRYEAPDRSQIVEQMRRIAADITSRSDTPPPIRYDGATVTLTTEFPLRRVTVLQHGRDPGALAVLRGARVERSDLALPAALELGMPARSGSPVYGRIHHLGGTGAIPAGTVTLTFDRPVDASTVQVLPEVDARLAVWLADAAGRPLPGPVPTVCAGEPFLVRGTLLSPRGDTLLGRVRAGGPFRMEAAYSGRTLPMNSARGGVFQASAPAALGDGTLSVSAEYPGYFHYRSPILTLRGQECRPRALGWRGTAPWSAKVTELDEAPPIDVVPTVDGAAVPAAELDRWTLRRIDGGKLPIDITRTAEGWRLRPHTRWGLACCTPTGDIRVELEAKSPNPREAAIRRTLQLRVEDVGFWAKCGWLVMLVLAIVLLATYIFLLLRKRRFSRGSEIVYERITPLARGRPQTEALPGKSWLVRMLLPTPAERTTVVEVTFEAGTRRGHIVIPPAAQTEQMYVAGERIEDPGRRPVRLAQGDALEIRRDGGRRDVYTYQVH